MSKLLKMIGPALRSAVRFQGQTSGAPTEHTCGIEPWKLPRRPPPPPPQKFPEHLLRPPCMPGSETGRFPPTCHTFQGFYCPVARTKYTYPSFSENIDFVPNGGSECWWVRAPLCEFMDMEENLPIRV